MPASPRSALVSLVSASLAALSFAAAGIVADTASAGNPVNVIVLKEHGVGTSAAAQPYLDKFIAIAAQMNGWDPASKGRYETTRTGAETFIKSEQPHFGIFSLAAFLAYKGSHNLDPVGSATLSTGGGQQYFLMSKTASSVSECKGKTLATDHFSDPKFIEKVVAAGAFKAGDFTVVTTTRFGQAGTKLVNGDAECALIDDAQLAELGKLPGGGAVKQAWNSDRLPPMVVAAFGAAPDAEKTAFQASLPKICPSSQQVCTDVGLQTLTTASAADYAKVVAAYNAPSPPPPAPATRSATSLHLGGRFGVFVSSVRLPAAFACALALASLTTGCCLLPASGPPQASLADVAAKGDALAISDALERLVAEGRDTPSDREYALKAIRARPENTAAYAFARAAVTGRVVQTRGFGGMGLAREVEHWSEVSRKLDPGFRNGAAARMLGTLYVMAPSGWLEHGDSEQGLQLLEGLVKTYPDAPENRLRLAEAYISLGDPGPATPYLCRCQAQKAELRRDDQLFLEHLFADAGHPPCPQEAPPASPAAPKAPAPPPAHKP